MDEVVIAYAAAAKLMASASGLWIAWPKKASKVPADMVDNTVYAIDATGSSLRFVIR